MNRSQLIQKGLTAFDLVILVGMGFLSLTSGSLFVPQHQFEEANNTARQADVNALLNAIGQYQADNHGNLPPGITTAKKEIAWNGANICQELVTKYLAALPGDPSLNEGNITNCNENYDTRFTVVLSSDGRVTVAAPHAQNGVNVSVTR